MGTSRMFLGNLFCGELNPGPLVSARQTLFQLSYYVFSPGKSTQERQRDRIEPTPKRKTWKTERRERQKEWGRGKIEKARATATSIPRVSQGTLQTQPEPSPVSFWNRKCNQPELCLLLVKPSILKTRRTLQMNSHSRPQPQTSEGALVACNVHE